VTRLSVAKGSAAETAYGDLLEDAMIFHLSPSFPGVDILVIRPDAIELIEVKGQKDKLYGKVLREAIDKLHAAQVRTAAKAPLDLPVRARLVHRRGPEAEFETLWAAEE
jgi:hypothetical protein